MGRKIQLSIRLEERTEKQLNKALESYNSTAITAFNKTQFIEVALMKGIEVILQEEKNAKKLHTV
jgi:hypothetical protein